MILRNFSKVVLCIGLGLIARMDGYAQKTLVELPRAFSRVKVMPQSTRTWSNSSARVLETYRQAKKAQNKYWEVLDWPGPSKRLSIAKNQKASELTLKDISPELMYPRAHFLKQDQLVEYFLAKHNLELRKWLPKLEANRQAIFEHREQFRREIQTVSQPASEDMAWLAKQITPDMKYLLLGELHEPLIGEQLPYLFKSLRKQHPKREIFLFTEFLFDGKVWAIKGHRQTFFPQQVPIWNSALRERISVIGLEPSFTFLAEPNFMERDAEQGGHTVMGDVLWASIEGVRIRNHYWHAVLEKYRQQYPEALFIIYAGSGHVDYFSPYSLGTHLAGPETYVVMLGVDTYEDGTTWLSSFFDYWTKGEFLDRVVFFKNKRLAQVAGFDARIRITRPVQDEFAQP